MKIISKVLTSGTFVKRDVTLNEIVLYQRETFIFLICFTDLFILLMIYSEVSNSDNNLAKYFSVWYVAVFIFDIIGRGGKSSKLLVKNLWILAVPKNLPGHEPDGKSVEETFWGIFNHKHDIVYYAECAEKSCRYDNERESSMRALEQVKDHNF